jgi:hypothetical protein
MLQPGKALSSVSAFLINFYKDEEFMIHATSFFKQLVFCLSICTILAAASPAMSADAIGEFSFTAGDQGFTEGPMCLKEFETDTDASLYALTCDEGKTIPAQVSVDGDLWWWQPALTAGQGVSYQIHADHEGKTKPNCKPIHIGQNVRAQVEVKAADKLFTVFVLAQPKPYLWPVMGPANVALTRAHPMEVGVEGERGDHPHHRSIWSCWGDVRVGDFSGDTQRNYWHQGNPVHQDREIVHRVLHAHGGPVFGQIVAEIDWTADNGKRDFREVRTYTFFGGNDNMRIIDVQNKMLFNDQDVMFADTKEAGICALRVAGWMKETSGKGQMRNSAGGKGAGECWGRPAHWCDYFAPKDGKTHGIAVMNCKKNPGNNPPRWHIRDYGLYACNNFGMKDFPGNDGKRNDVVFKKGEQAVFNYRILLHTGNTDEADIAGQWMTYSSQPEIKGR